MQLSTTQMTSWLSFTDGTLMSITWPHTLTDGPGLTCVFRAWCALSAKKFNTAPRYMGYDMDTLAEFGFDEEVQQSVLESVRRNLAVVPCKFAHQIGLGKSLFGVSMAPTEAKYLQQAVVVEFLRTQIVKEDNPILTIMEGRYQLYLKIRELAVEAEDKEHFT